jgi:hypothetical protein
MPTSVTFRAVAVAASIAACSATTPAAAEQPVSVGVRPVLALADGTPANDIPGGGSFARWHLGERWALSVAVELAKFDFEEPARVVGLAQADGGEAIDAKAESQRLGVWAERRLGAAGGPSRWYTGFGVGAATIDVPDAVGPLAGGGTFHVRTEADTELIAALALGWERELGRRWLLDTALRWEQHFADWQVVDTVSGRTGAVGDYSTFGAHLGVGWRF